MNTTSLSSQSHARARVEFDGFVEFTHDGRTTIQRYGNADAAREAVLDDVTAIARRLDAPVRLSTEGARGYLELWVRPDGSVEQIPVALDALGPSAAEQIAGSAPSVVADETVHAGALSDNAAILPEPALPDDRLVTLHDVPTKTTVASPAAGSTDARSSSAVQASVSAQPAVTAEGLITAAPLTATSPATVAREIPTPELDLEIERTVLLRPDRGRTTTAPVTLPIEPVVTLHSSTGRSYELRGSGVLGRHASAPDAVALDDPEGTVSNRHARFCVEAEGLVIADLGSSNGTTITIASDSESCEPGVEYPAPRGARIDLGSLFVIVV